MADPIENPIVNILCAEEREPNWLVRDFMLQGAMVCLAGEPGCLAGNTTVRYRRGARRSSRDLPLREFYRKFNGLPCSIPPPFTVDGPTYLHSLADDGTMFYNRVLAVVESGVKPLVEVAFNDGMVLRATADHPVLTRGGFVEAGRLRTRQAVVARGSMTAQGRGGRCAKPPRVVVNTRFHPYGAVKVVDGKYFYKRINRARLVVEAVLNGLDYDDYLHILKHDRERARTLRYIPTDFEVHHIDRNPMHDAFENLEVRSQENHARLHGIEDSWAHFNNEFTREVRVRGVKAVAPEMTYDVQMAAPVHNFCANGIVVHNSGKSYVSYTIGLAVASGIDALSGLIPAGPPKRVLYFDEENSEGDRNKYLKRSWLGLHHRGRGPDLGLLLENFWPLHFTLGNDDWRDVAAMAIEQVQPQLLVFDTATPAFNIMDENSNAEATQAIKNVRHLMAMTEPTASAIVLRHAKMRTEKGGRRTMRGAKAWQGAADGVIFQVKATGRPRKDGLALTRLEPDKTRAYGLRHTIYITPEWTDEERSGLTLYGSTSASKDHLKAERDEDAELSGD